MAHEDYKFTDLALKTTEIILHETIKGINEKLESLLARENEKAKAEIAKEVVKQLQIIEESLESEIVKKLKSVRESLDAKQRALNYFSIAFIGKTKAGKSTLHAIITGEGWDAIGVGKQRTTRLNRFYEWNNIRIIDTPGIGAPGGKTDEEIAQSIINESDVICYVVTNDSIQESEFKFLHLLKQKAKPLIVLLNVHKNFRDSRRGLYEVERFLKNPNQLFSMDGSSGLAGHIERIRRYAQQHYGNDYFEIVPVMLLAAHLSYELEYQHHKDELVKASRIQNFLDEIWLSLVEHGAIRRSQTLLGCTVSDIENPHKFVTLQAQTCKNLAYTLKNKHEIIRQNIQKATNDSLESLQYQIEVIFQDARNAIPSLAENHWDNSETSLKQAWEKQLKNIRFEDRLSTVYQETVTTFSKAVQELFEEVGKELQIVAKLDGINFNLVSQDSGDEQSFFVIGGGLLAVAGGLMVFFPPLAAVGFVVGIVGGVISFIGGFLKSKDQKRREAVENISKSLKTQLDTQQKNILAKAKEEFCKVREEIATSVDSYFKDLIGGLDAIALQLESAQNSLESEVNRLNCAYAKRIIDWCLKKYEPLTPESIESVIAKVTRDFGRRLDIETKALLELQRTQDEINRVLQEDTYIQISPPPIQTDTPNFNLETPTSLAPEPTENSKEIFQGVVSIDLGTTNSAVAVIENGKPTIIPNKEGFTITPSVVAYTNGGTCLVGQAAKRQAISNPQNTFDSVMRFIGRHYDEVIKQSKKVPHQVLHDKNSKVKFDCPILGQQLTPEEILAQILRKLADDASEYLNKEITQIVLTVPTYFDEIQRHAVKEASHLARLKVLRIITNSTAAALAYGLDKKEHETVLVFDLGGGHLSISTLEIGDGVFDILSHGGDTYLGGNDFDQEIVTWLAQEFKQLEGIALDSSNYDKQAWQRLREAAEKAKIELSSATQTEIDLPWIASTASDPKHLKMTLTRHKFEQLCSDLIVRCHHCVENALRDAKLNKNDIDNVILVGGATRIPIIQELLKQYFGKQPKRGFNSDELVALGASVEAGVLGGSLTGLLLLDVTPFSLGVESLGGVMTKIIPRNTTIPTKKSEVISTAVDGQTSIEIHVIQGEREMANENKSLGILRLDGIAPAPRGVPQIEIIFDIDANKIINVIAKDKSTGKEQSMSIAEALNSNSEYQGSTSNESEEILLSLMAPALGTVAAHAISLLSIAPFI